MRFITDKLSFMARVNKFFHPGKHGCQGVADRASVIIRDEPRQLEQPFRQQRLGVKHLLDRTNDRGVEVARRLDVDDDAGNDAR